MTKIIPTEAIQRREYWVKEIQKLSGNFGSDTERLEMIPLRACKRITPHFKKTELVLGAV
jgi:hypothetical protein